MIKVYSVEWCPECNKVKKYLDTKKVAYEVEIVADEKESRDIVLEISGQRSVPVTTINDNVIVGFKKADIDKALSEM